jgi:hypothetical protein
LWHDKPQGYGAALRTGLAAARYPLLFTMPAKGEYQPEELSRLLAVVDQADSVCGYRCPRPWFRAQWQGWGAFLGFGLWVKDVACHFRLYRRSIFAHIPVQSSSCFADIEILAKANFLTCLFAEVEVTWKPAVQPAPRGPVWADAWRLFRNPEFGPAPSGAMTKPE